MDPFTQVQGYKMQHLKIAASVKDHTLPETNSHQFAPEK